MFKINWQGYRQNSFCIILHYLKYSYRGVLAYFGFGILGLFAHLKLGFSVFEIRILESHHSKMGSGYSLVIVACQRGGISIKPPVLQLAVTRNMVKVAQYALLDHLNRN